MTVFILPPPDDEDVAPPLIGSPAFTSGYALSTFGDMIDHLIEWGYGHGADSAPALLRECVQRAYLEIFNAHDWPANERYGRLYLHAPQTTGTIAYNNSTRIVTLSGATWEDWVADATIRVPAASDGPAGIDCDVEALLSETTLRLTAGRNPGADRAAGTAYTAYRQWYALPADFMALKGIMDSNLFCTPVLASAAELMRLYRVALVTAPLRLYAIAQRPNRTAEKCLWVYPAANSTRTADIVYVRRPRELIHSGKNPEDTRGTVTLTAGSATVAGTDTAFRDTMIGAVLRVGDTADLPTSRWGLKPYHDQYVIASVESSTSLTLTQAVVGSYTNALYVISDVIDVEACATGALRAYAEYHLALAKNLESGPNGRPGYYRAEAERALRDAMAGALPTRYDAAQKSAPGSYHRLEERLTNVR